MDKKLSVENLTISFRTINGNVQAVRGINFDLYSGETLCIVGESGSGKSVTSRAILGILAQNALVQNGKIFYDGKDLLRLSEEQFHKIRGDKIAMIFQDPMSSLNPIMKIGKQLTEAMILKNKANRRESRKAFNTLLDKSIKYMNLAYGEETAKENATKANMFNQFEVKHLELENKYVESKDACEDLIIFLEDLIFRNTKNAIKNIKRDVKYINENYKIVQNDYYCKDITSLESEVTALNEQFKTLDIKSNDFMSLNPYLTNMLEFLKNVKDSNTVAPNFFALGYYLTFVSQELPEFSDYTELNKMLRATLDKEFMLEFIERVEKALYVSREESLTKTKAIYEKLKEFRNSKIADADKKEYVQWVKDLNKEITDSIDALDIYKASPCYTFPLVFIDLINLYFSVDKKNLEEETRFNKETAKHKKLEEKGKTITWSVVPKTVWDKVEVTKELNDSIDQMLEYFEQYIARGNNNLNERAIDVIDYFKEKASNVATIVTKKVAKNRAIKLMEEVGIPEPQKRYNQYPFEFSGGMRQRIVIAIALSANPDILICDEPTTALDVTIQSQILELITKLKVERNLSIIFITHDMGVVANMADRIAVMYAGKIVEIGTSEDIFYEPKHPYTWALLSSMPDLDTKERLDSIPGTPPNMIYPPVGDAFAARNKYAMKIDFEQQPPMFKVSDTHYAATWLLHPSAPKVNPPKTILDRVKRMKERVDENATK